MRTIKNQKGYTVTELLIVVSITGFLFISTMAMIQGQTAKYNYQDSMRQLQQLAQQAVKDTENGYFPGANGDDVGSVFVGKRVTFCGGLPPADADGTPDSGCTDRTKMRIQNMQNNGATGVKKVGADSFITLPGGLIYKGSYWWDTKTDRQPGTTGYMTRFALLAGNGSGSGCTDNVFCAGITGAQQSIGLATYWGADFPAGGRAVCFEGYRNGSLVFGVDKSTVISMNMDDPNCYGTFP